MWRHLVQGLRSYQVQSLTLTVSLSLSLSLSHPLYPSVSPSFSISVCVCVCVQPHLVCSSPCWETWYYQCGSPKTFLFFFKWYPEVWHQTLEAAWVMMHRSAAGTKAAMVKRMKIGEEEEKKRWSKQKTRSPAVCSGLWFGVWAFGGLCESGTGGKVAPWRKTEEGRRDERLDDGWH